jgi:hypothetical protein
MANTAIARVQLTIEIDLAGGLGDNAELGKVYGEAVEDAPQCCRQGLTAILVTK